MALAIHLSSYISNGYNNPMVWRLYETGSGVFVDEHVENGPHGQVYNFSFVDNIRDIVYTVKLYDVPGGIGVGSLVKSHDLTVTTSVISMDADIETIVDGGEQEDPVGGTSTSPVIAALIGKDYYLVQRGVGQRREDRLPEIQINDDGSYTLLNDETFTTQDTWIIKIRAQYVINPAGSQNASTIYRDIMVVTADYTVTALDIGKKIIVDGMLPVVTLHLPDVVDWIEKVSLWIESVGTAHINVVIKAGTGETITATGMVSNTFILSRGVHAEVIKVEGVLYGFTDDNDIKCRGQIEWGYSVGLNRVKAYGTEYLTANYPGLKKAMDAMQAGVVVSYTQWNSTVTVDGVVRSPYRGFFALSDDTTHFRVPDMRNLSIRGLNGDGADSERLTQGAGGYQIGMLQSHYHPAGTETDPNSGGVYRRGAPHPTRYWDTGNNQFNEEASTGDAGGVETRPENIGLIPLIII